MIYMNILFFLTEKGGWVKIKIKSLKMADEKIELEISLISSFYFLNTNEKVLYQTNEFLIILIVFSFPHKFNF